MFPMFLSLLLLPAAIFLLVVAVMVSPWNLVAIYLFVWICWPRKKRDRST
jgi:hypothetical protein